VAASGLAGSGQRLKTTENGTAGNVSIVKQLRHLTKQNKSIILSPWSIAHDLRQQR
jgi:cytochrome c-type biogenesis protein CcmH/NrfF